MRKIAIHVLSLALSVLVWSAAAQAAPPPAGIPDLSEFRLYFLHLANLDAAADKADAEGTSGDTASWRSFEQKMAGLTESEGALLKDVAYRCNQTLDEDLEGSEPMEVVREAVDELETVLGPSAFEAVAGRIRGFLRPGITRMPAAVEEVEEVEEGLEPTDGSVQEEDELPVELPVEPLAFGPSVNVVSLTYKLPDGTFMAECITSPNDAETIQRYAGGVVHSCLVNGGGLTAPISVPCGPGNGCIANLPPALPGRSRSTLGTHGLRMKYSATCLGQPFDGLEDPMHYCRNGTLPPHYFETGDVPPIGGTPTCWDPQVSCVIATSVSSQVVYLDIVPREATIHAGGQKQFRGILDMLTTWSTNGPGTIDEVTGLYKAPATVIGEQTATIKGCDAYHPGDCTTTTIKVVPINVSVSPASVAELLPSDDQSFTATVTPSGTGLTVEWSLIDPSNASFISTTSGSTAAVLKAPANERISGDQVTITVKACVRPAPDSEPVCGTAQVTVPKMLFYIDGSKKTLAPGETLQLTAFVFGSSAPQPVDWASPTEGTLNLVIPEDPYVVLYKAPTFPAGSGVVVKACLKASPDFCATYPISFRAEPTITAVTSDSGKWNAGTLTSFTITGTGFGSSPVVKFTSLQPTVTLASDTRIEGQVRLPIAMGGKTTVPSVLVTYPNGDTAEGFSSPKAIAPAILSVQPATAELHGGESRLFSFICLQASGELCMTVEPPTWTASPGAIDASGRYTAPASVPSNTTATVKACWSIDICATAQVTLLAPPGPVVVVSPKTVSLMPGQTQPFTAPVTGTPNTAVTWSIQPPGTGSITQAGVYTAPSPFGGPATVTIVATSQADATRNDTATVTLIPAVLSVTSTPSPPSANHGTVITWTATASGGTPGTIQYALFRRKAGTTAWNPEVWQPSNVLTWTPGAADVATWEIRIGAKDVNTAPGAHALHDPGPVQVRAPLTFVCPTSTPFANHGTAFTWTVSASGGTGTGRQYALFRRRPGTIPWTPDVTAPAWQPGNILSWTPAVADVGHWEIYIWIKDSGTPPNMNAHGYAAGCNPGPIQVLRPITLTTTPSPASAYYGFPITWTATASGADPATVQYSWGRRRVGTADWIPAVQVWQGNTFNWTPTSAETGVWEIAVVVKDGSTPPTLNTYGYAAYYNPGQVNVVAPLTVSGTMSPAWVNHGTAITWTATASGGTSVNRMYAFFRKRPGDTVWTPNVTTPAWQTGNVLSWTPAAGDAGTWDTYIWVKDSATPPAMNTYGHAAWYNSGTVQIVAPLGLTSTASPALATHGNTITWTATATGGVPASTQFALRRRVTGSTAWTPASPAWQASNVLSWTPTSGDVATWEIAIWVRDGNTPPTMNGSGYAASYNPGSVRVVAPLTVTGNGSPGSAYYGNPITWTATGSGGTGSGRQYAFFRKRSGATTWIPAVTSPAWQTSNVMSWTPGSADAGIWDTSIWFRDANTPANANGYGYGAYYMPGPVQVLAPPTVTGTGSPASVNYGTTVTWTATASGGTGSAKQYAFFRKKVGTSNWIPSITSPAWQASNVMSWTPASSDTGTWETSIWVKDADTPPTMNGYGFANYYNPGPVQVTGPLTLSCSGSPASATSGTTLTWTANAGGGHPPTIQYAFFRRRSGTGNSGWIPSINSPAWQSSNVMTWTPTSADVGPWDVYTWVRDGNTPANMNVYGYAVGCNSGSVQVTAPLSLSGTGSPSSADQGTEITWIAYASGGYPPTTQYALFRRPSGTGNSGWIPSINSPAWQSSNVMSWTPTSSDVGTWDIYIWVKDGNTPAGMNNYGYAAGYNAGPVEVTAPVYQSYEPIGYVDGYDRQHIWGWACDPDYPWESNRVDFWSTSWQYLGSADAYYWSSSPINSACGGGSAHYFDFYHNGAIPPGTHFWVWSIDLPYATPGGVNVPIGGNGGIAGGNEFVMP